MYRELDGSTPGPDKKLPLSKCVMQLTLVSPPFSSFPAPPINLLLLGAVAKSIGWQVNVVDLDIDHRNHPLDESWIASSVSAILERNPCVVGFTGMCNNMVLVIRLAEALRAIRWDGFILLGGPEASAAAENLLYSFPAVDAVLAGEAEAAFRLLLDAVRLGQEISSIPGLVHRADGRVISNPSPDLIDMAARPFPDYGLVDLSVYPAAANQGLHYFPVEAGRGCYRKCSFCSTSFFWQRKLRMRPVEDLAAEVAYLLSNYGIRKFMLIHDDISLQPGYLTAVCDVLRPLEVVWKVSSSQRGIPEAMLPQLARSGCKEVFYGVETFHRHEPAIEKKRLGFDDCIRFLGAHKRAEVAATCSFVLGFPRQLQSEIDKDVDAIFRMARRGAGRCLVNQFVPLHGSAFSQAEFPIAWPEKMEGTVTLKLPDSGPRVMELIKHHPDVFFSFRFAPAGKGTVDDLVKFLKRVAVLVDFYPHTISEIASVLETSPSAVVHRLSDCPDERTEILGILSSIGSMMQGASKTTECMSSIAGVITAEGIQHLAFLSGLTVRTRIENQNRPRRDHRVSGSALARMGASIEPNSNVGWHLRAYYLPERDEVRLEGKKSEAANWQLLSSRNGFPKRLHLPSPLESTPNSPGRYPEPEQQGLTDMAVDLLSRVIGRP